MSEAPTVSQYMTTRARVITPEARISEAHALLREQLEKSALDSAGDR